ncbi:Small-subunit processome Utp11 [Penicillium odoratum]|uniref:Small-subunit processome Utp11 n=1 Tax=Penicillium odoratum TaxID=1167516 RepID=UPI00254787BD|nr:Small-subunit processome Utp11 [Penicillium odoratum]KAJ5753236.1 Small-subunit processome Utp11 [Penicillium odoratum]
MSSMRNAVQRRNHKERAQLQGREKWGILEKHKDYSLRAKDYNAKKSKIKRLEEKARDRNPDEFHFGMMGGHNQTQGKHGRGGAGRVSAAGLSHDAIKLLKTQDQGYLRTAGERIRRQIETLQREIQLQDGMNDALGVKTQEKKKEPVDDDEFDGFDDLDDDVFDKPTKSKPRKVVFADDRDEQKALKQRGSEMADATESDDEALAKTRTPKEIAAKRQALVEARRARKLRKRAIESRQNKLTALQKQYEGIQAAEREVDWQRGKMDNSVGGTNKNGIKWKIRERKR